MNVKGYEIKPEANLRGADLRGADLRGANLRGADLWGADLWGADLRGADLWGADLRCADLQGADLRDADLRYANLQGADLRGANLRGADLPYYSIVPTEGGFVAWKKLEFGHIAKLLIPAGAERVSTPMSRKCRARYVIVLEGEGRGIYNDSVVYKPGACIRADKWNPDIREECTHGIHFFMTREEAEEYLL